MTWTRKNRTVTAFLLRMTVQLVIKIRRRAHDRSDGRNAVDVILHDALSSGFIHEIDPLYTAFSLRQSYFLQRGRHQPGSGRARDQYKRTVGRNLF